MPPSARPPSAIFSKQGFPTLHDEDWRFTNVAPIAARKPVLAPAPNGIEPIFVATNSFTALKASRLVFVQRPFFP